MGPVGPRSLISNCFCLCDCCGLTSSAVVLYFLPAQLPVRDRKLKIETSIKERAATSGTQREGGEK